jgi:ATP synthase protein I
MAEREPTDPDSTLRDTVERKRRRKTRARRERGRGLWFWLGMMGVVGWSVAIPTVLGTAIGAWIDATWPGRLSFTLMGLGVGLAAGCVIAWNWVRRNAGMGRPTGREERR